MAVNAKALLRSAKDSFDRKEYQDCISDCKKALSSRKKAFVA